MNVYRQKLAPFSYFEGWPPAMQATFSLLCHPFMYSLHPLRYGIKYILWLFFAFYESLSISWSSSLNCLHRFFICWSPQNVAFLSLPCSLVMCNILRSIINIQQKYLGIWSRRPTRQCYYILRRPFKPFIHKRTQKILVYIFTCIRSSLQCYCCCHLSTLQTRKFKNPRKIYARGTQFFIVLLRCGWHIMDKTNLNF